MSHQNPSIDRVRKVAEQWYLSEPLLFAAWTTHRVVCSNRISTVRVHRGLVEINPAFISSLDDSLLRAVMKLETLRIILKHPYERRRSHARLAYESSNLAIQECTLVGVPLPSAEARFGSNEHNGKHFEYYYQLLEAELPEHQLNLAIHDQGDDGPSITSDAASLTAAPLPEREPAPQPSTSTNTSHATRQDGASDQLQSYCSDDTVASENATLWDEDTFYGERINEIIQDINATDRWGSVAGAAREAILATLTPRLDYRRVLRAFRASVLSSKRRLTRTKPSRRYGFDYLGSRRDFCTRLLFAVDVSGSVGTTDVRKAFSIVNRLFQYGVEAIEVIWFDTEIRNTRPLRMTKAMAAFEIVGRGGTSFQPLMDYLDDHPHFDGLIIFTDGIAPSPEPPQSNRKTRVFWLFNHQENWQRMHSRVEIHPGMMSAFILAD